VDKESCESEKENPTVVDTVCLKKLPEDKGTHSSIDELHLMDMDKSGVLSGKWISIAIINASQYIEQAI